MPPRSADILIRIVLGIAGLASMGFVIVVTISTEGWASTTRVMAALPFAALFVYGTGAASELRDRYESRSMLQFRRLGKRPLILSSSDQFSTTEIQRPTPYAEAQLQRFSLRPTGSLVVFCIGLFGSLLAWNGANSAMKSEELSESGFFWLVVLPVALWAAARSLIRLMLSSRAVAVDSNRLTLGVALGYVSPVRVNFADIDSVVIVTDKGRLDFIVEAADERTYHVDGKHLANAEGLVDWFEQNLAGADTAPVTEQTLEEPAPVLSKPVAMSGSVPHQDQIERAQRVLSRRVHAAYAVFGFTFALAAFVAWSWIELKAEQDQVEAHGTAISAEVFRVNNRSRGAPGEIHVRFVANNQTYERIIYAGWFRDFDYGLRGETVTILFDPADEGIAKLPGRTHHPEWLGMSVLLSLVLVPLVVGAVQGTRNGRAALKTDHWQRVTFSTGPKKNSGMIVRRPDDAQDHRIGPAGGRHGDAFADSGAWMASNDRIVILLPDNSERVLSARVGKGSPLRG